jgi:predicted nucleic acid-binding protein
VSSDRHACDTSVLVAAHLAQHPRHDAALAAVNDTVDSVPAHALLECYSVLTRLPGADRLDGRAVAASLQVLELVPLALPARQHIRTIELLAGAGIHGGAVYDGLVAATARHHGCTLVSLDRRARATYDVVGVRYTIV